MHEFDFDGEKERARIVVTEDTDANPINFRTINDVKLLHEPVFRLKGDVEQTIMSAKVTNSPESCRRAQQLLLKYKGVSLPNNSNVEPFMVDCPIRESWLASTKLPRKELGHLEAVIIFGRKLTLPHVDTGATAFCYTIVKGEKEWLFWKPGDSPLLVDRAPDYVVRTRAGDSIFGPVGWWHAVKTISNGSIHVGITTICRMSLVSYVTSSKSLYKAGENVEKEAKIILDFLNETYPENQYKNFRKGEGPAYQQVCKLAAQYSCGTTRRTSSGNKRRKRISQRDSKKRRQMQQGNATRHFEKWRVVCVCGINRTNYDDGKPMVQCGGCSVWVHLECVVRPGTTIKSQFNCKKCSKIG